jgi:circadian clock protein KaiB
MKNRLKKKLDATRELEKSFPSGPQPEDYVLRLYITGMTPRSAEAFASIKAICEKYLQGRYELEVIDLYQHPALASEDQIIAAPTLIKQLPAPLRRLVGNLSEEERVLSALNLQPAT